jgi:hypothetical protein
VFSGAIEGLGGGLMLFYTSIGKRDPNSGSRYRKTTIFVWEKHPGNPILSLKHHGTTKVHEWHPFRFAKRGDVSGGGRHRSARWAGSGTASTRLRIRH